MQNRNRKMVKTNYRRNEKIYMVLLMLMFMSGVEENISLKKKKSYYKYDTKNTLTKPNS